MKVSHACTRTTLVNKLNKYDETIAIVHVVRFIFLCPIRSQHLLDPLKMVWWELVPSPGSPKMLRHLIALQINK